MPCRAHLLPANHGRSSWLACTPLPPCACAVRVRYACGACRYGVQLRDFRVLDPVLGATYPACLLCREGAIIVNLDHIKVGDYLNPKT